MCASTLRCNDPDIEVLRILTDDGVIWELVYSSRHGNGPWKRITLPWENGASIVGEEPKLFECPHCGSMFSEAVDDRCPHCNHRTVNLAGVAVGCALLAAGFGIVAYGLFALVSK
jgi:hypothetical protein